MPRDHRTFITVHDGMPDHPKIDPLSDKAFRHLVGLWCWASRNLTDGFIPEATWLKRTNPRTRGELLDVLAHPVPGGVYMHDYLEHQRSKDEVAALREKRARAGSLGGLRAAESKLRDRQIDAEDAAHA